MSQLESAAESQDRLHGTVLAVQANFYKVLLDSNQTTSVNLEQNCLLCTRRTRLKKIGQNV